MIALNWRTRAVVTAATLGVVGVGAANAPAHAATLPTVLTKIRYCESGNNYSAQNPSSTASGAYQFLDSTWRGLSASAGYSHAKDAPQSVQDAAALELYNSSGTAPWAASQSCWGSLSSAPTTTTGGGSSSSTTSTSSSSSSSSSAASSTASTAASTTSRSSARAAVATTKKEVNEKPANKPLPAKGAPLKVAKKDARPTGAASGHQKPAKAKTPTKADCPTK
ncbi:transglycosylase family protein [Calidifontibacter terrae]